MKIKHRQTAICLLALLVVATGAVAGSFTPILQPQFHLTNALNGSDSLNDLTIIASRNLRIGLQLLLGFVSLGIYSLIQLFGIGFAFGSIVCSAARAGIQIHKIALLLGSHTFIEFAGFILIGAIEFEAAIIAYRKLRHDRMPDERGYWIGLAKQAALGFALILLAAIIEVYVTGTIARRI
jgi:uncharacterized membrane protein SpoIIM required for sporulation